MKIQKKKNFFWGGCRGGGGLGWGGGSGWGIRVDVNEELKFLGKLKEIELMSHLQKCSLKTYLKRALGGSGLGGGGGQDGCERRIKFFVKIQKTI